MTSMSEPVYIATRGSALALVQANQILAACRAALPERRFELKIIKTTGDKLQTASLANPDHSLPKGLFTKELETALLENEATLAVHSLKDLPTELPTGLKLGAVTRREDARDILILRADKPVRTLSEVQGPLVVATSSPRRKAQLGLVRPDFGFVEIRGNVGTRLRKLAETDVFHATVLAAAGLKRLGYQITEAGELFGSDVPAGLAAFCLSPEEMIPAVGQAAIGIETAEENALAEEICERLNHTETWHRVTAERAFLRAMGGGCQSPLAAHATLTGDQLELRAISFQTGAGNTATGHDLAQNALALGRSLAATIDA